MPSPGQPATSEPPAAASSEDPERPAFLDRSGDAPEAAAPTFTVRMEHTYVAEGSGVNRHGVDLETFDLHAFLFDPLTPGTDSPSLAGGRVDKIRRIVIEQET